MALLEKDLERELLKACKRFMVIKSESLTRGFPDRMIFDTKNEQILYVELKNDTYYERSPMQKYWAKWITACGGKYFCKDLEFFIENILKEEKI